jgi:hypothetical protein
MAQAKIDRVSEARHPMTTQPPWDCATGGTTDEARASTRYHDRCGACEALPSDAVRAASAALDTARGALTRMHSLDTAAVTAHSADPTLDAACDAALNAAPDAAHASHTNAQAAHADAIRAAAARHP